MAIRTADERPSPEALLEAAEKEGRGKLKIFLGAAPGVGKTYEMLTQGRRRRLEGTDVVIGVVETHGRADTEAMTANLKRLPPAAIPYRGKNLDEFDLDAALKRHPELIRVDELGSADHAVEGFLLLVAWLASGGSAGPEGTTEPSASLR